MSFKRQINPRDYLAFGDADKIKFLIVLANLAPSSHNMQPWKFRADSQSIIVLPNFDRKLVVADPDSREFYITLGTVIGSLKVICDSYGLKYKFSIGRDLTKEIGRFDFESLESTSMDLVTLEAFINRHNSRLPFRKDSLPNSFLDKIKSIIVNSAQFDLVSNEKNKSDIEKVVLNSVREAFSDKAFCLELSPWVKPSVGNHEDGLPGYNLGMPFLVSLVFPFMLRHFDISNLQVKIHKKMLSNAAAYGVISTNEENPNKWIEIGEAFIKVAVECEKNKISIGIMQASIENRKDRQKLKALLGSSQNPQMFFRLGYCDLLHKHSPRRPIEKVLST